ncbi:PHP domain-containing protein [Halorhabdus sp. CBA1104]|uniref:PHP domain-containing protein n=1 Tax=Halorhabdus sp. CBA1104 TaxID=1380432 RepID=UPI0012B2FD73|nr:PHP domain-containing protein [Halorhabdus sp. CBA1104]QGN06477.1 PHP domain-containing protein [Halorhabdus sp. CBA1104]
MHDYHVHTTYSDGSLLPRMVAAAEQAGLDGLGLADHCNVFDTEGARAYRDAFGFNLDLTHERRRRAIERYRDRTDLRLYDGVEMDYHPDHEDAIDEFLADAAFDYAIGSVHQLDGANVHDREHFAALSPTQRERAVETYVDRVVGLLDSDLFDIAAHIDLVERNPALRGLLSENHYRRIADALAASQTVPEINAGRVTREYGDFHPSEEFFETLVDAGVGFTIGSDAHEPQELLECTDRLESTVEHRDVPIVELGL